MILRCCRFRSPLSPSIASTLFVALITTAPRVACAELSAENLRCEYLRDPTAVDAPHPRLFWQVFTKERKKRQSAYRILVASSREQLAHDVGDLWDSGRVDSAETIQVVYGGKPLSSGQQSFWKVRVWNDAGKPSAWSKSATWTAGLLRPEDWTARWIAAKPEVAEPDLTKAQWIWHADDGNTQTLPAGTRWFRGTVEIPANTVVTGAQLVISADDRFAFSLNGSPLQAGPNRVDGWKNYRVFNVAKLLRSGTNTVLLQAENLSPGPAGVIARLEITTASGSRILQTNGEWESSTAETGPFAPVRMVGDYGTNPWGTLSDGADVGKMLPPSYYRRTFPVIKPVKRALLYATALGAYELSVNGKRVNNDVLSPGWTDFHKRVHYLAYDVTAQLCLGANTLGAILGDGWYASYIAFTGKRRLYGGDPKLRLQLDIEYKDGSHATIGTDSVWKTAEGSIQSADLLMGYTADTRNEIPNWDRTGFDDSRWRAAAVLPNSEIRLEAQPNQPIRPVLRLSAQKRSEPVPGKYIYDLGQNMVGWIRLTVTGEPGDRITIRHGERLNPDGTLYTANLRTAQATDTYVLKGGKQTLEPKFTFHGFQYVEVTGVRKPPAPKAVKGVVITSDLVPSLTFRSDNPLLNRLVQNIGWGWRGNSLDVPTDCPQRDERAGWTADAQVFAKTAMFHTDAAPFFTKWMTDMEDGQRADGAYPDVAPSFIGHGNAAWEDAGVICAYRLYEMYGDTTVLEQHWASLTRFMIHLAQVAPDGIREPGAYGDWLLLDGPQLSTIHGTAYYYRSATLMAKMAQALGKQDEAARYQAVAAKVKEAFITRFVTPEGRIQDKEQESQTFYAIALEYDLLPASLRQAAATRLIAMIDARGEHLATGFIGTPVLLPALASAGRADRANDLLLTDTYPSWLYQVKLGATTLWERWDGWTPDKGFQDVSMNSFNHYWLGCVGEWLYTGVVGIDTETPGWGKIILRPQVDGSLRQAQVTYDSVRGRISSGWVKEARGGLTLSVTIPANTTATVYVPATATARVTESNKPADASPGVTFLRRETNAAVYSIGSGTYVFRVRKP